MTSSLMSREWMLLSSVLGTKLTNCDFGHVVLIQVIKLLWVTAISIVIGGGAIFRHREGGGGYVTEWGQLFYTYD